MHFPPHKMQEGRPLHLHVGKSCVTIRNVCKMPLTRRTEESTKCCTTIHMTLNTGIPLGPVAAGNRLTLRFACDESPEVLLRTWDGAERLYPMVSVGESLYEATVTVPDKPMLFWYDFIIRRADGDVRYGNSRDQLGGEGACYDGQPDSYQVTVYDPAYHTPEYLRHGIIYQIFPDRFYKDKNGQKGRLRKIAAAHPDATFHEEWNERPTLDLDPENGDNRALDFFGGTLRASGKSSITWRTWV